VTNTLYSGSTPAVTNCYNRLGQLSSVVCNGMTDSLTYNWVGALMKESFSGGVLGSLSLTNGYDQWLRRTNLVALKANNPLIQQSYGFDPASRLQTVMATRPRMHTLPIRLWWARLCLPTVRCSG